MSLSRKHLGVKDTNNSHIVSPRRTFGVKDINNTIASPRKPFVVKDRNIAKNIVPPRTINTTKVPKGLRQKTPSKNRNNENMESLEFTIKTDKNNTANTKSLQPYIPNNSTQITMPPLIEKTASTELKSTSIHESTTNSYESTTSIDESTASIDCSTTSTDESTTSVCQLAVRIPKPTKAKRREKERFSLKFANTIPVADFKDDLHLFADVDTPIRKLTNDCLLTIFELCKDSDAFYAITRVSRSWRSLSLQPILWRIMEYKWPKFNRQLTLLHQPSTYLLQLQFIRTLTISSQDYTPTQLDLNIPKISPFQQLVNLNVIDLNLEDIGHIILWMSHITTLNCENIRAEETSQVYLPSFSKLHKLKSLRLQFAKPCSLTVSYFTYGSKQILPESLETLELIDIYDREENLITTQDIFAAATYLSTTTDEQGIRWDREFQPLQILDAWQRLENRLATKYSMLSYLSNLTTLSLNRTSSFTARVWRECLIPCGSKLVSLSLTGWSGTRESPQSIMNRRNTARRQAKRPDQYVRDVELALSEFITSLAEVQSITLDDFLCTQGVVLGINELVKDGKKEYHLENTNMDHAIDQYLDEPLYNFKILIKNSGESR